MALPLYDTDIAADPTAQPVTHVFDGVAVCAGTNNWPAPPAFEGKH